MNAAAPFKGKNSGSIFGSNYHLRENLDAIALNPN
jgi:hypothetical protein